MPVMNALVNISFEAPISYIRKWIEKHNLTSHLSNWENEISLKDNEELTNYELNSLRWYLEALWALMWVTKMIADLDETQWCGENIATMSPNLEQDESNEKIGQLSELRTDGEIYKMFDLYYRCIDERIKA